MRSDFIRAIKSNQASFGLALIDAQIERLADYYELVQEHNSLLHLVARCSPEEFATRHILESLMLLEYLPENTCFADVGSGAGLPSIPCLIVRDNLKAVLIESKEKKAKFLLEAISKLGLKERVEVVNRQFEEVKTGDFRFITCRALDKFTEKLPRLLKWSKKRSLLLLGGDSLRESLKDQRAQFTERLTPLSQRRYLFIIQGEN